MAEQFAETKQNEDVARKVDLSQYEDGKALAKEYKDSVLNEIERLNRK